MSTTGRPEGVNEGASDVASRLAAAEFVRLVARADGDALAALGLLADGLRKSGIPYQASVIPLHEDGDRATDADITVALGRETANAEVSLGVGDVASPDAYEIARDLGKADPFLALAGAVAAGTVPDGAALSEAESRGLAREPGLAIPVTDPVDGLAHSTLVHGSFSGSIESAERTLAGANEANEDEDLGRRLASLAALDVAGDEDGTARGAEFVSRLLRPYVGGPFETVGGYADVLEALARERPGLGVATVLGNGDHDAALAVWRDHAVRAHTAIREATTGRYDGLFVARCDGDTPVGTVARLLRDFRSPEPVVLVVADGTVAAVGSSDGPTDVGATMREATRSVGGTGDGTTNRARGQFQADDTEFVVAFREAQ